MFTLVEFVHLSQGYIRGRFVLHQRQSFIEEPLVYRLVFTFTVNCEFSGGDLSTVFCDITNYNVTTLKSDTFGLNEKFKR